MTEDIVLMKGNEAIAHAAIRYGVDGYFGYPITPQSEIIETLMDEAPWKTTGMVVLQAESEVAAINMVYGGAACGKYSMTSSSSPGISLKQEGISYIAGAELPCLLVNVQRGGPGLGTIQPSQADYFQTVKGGGHGDYRLITLAPNSVQEMADFVGLGFELAFKYRNPAMILTDGVIGQMMEKVKLPAFRRRRTEQEIREQCPWATLGKTPDRAPNIITSLEMEPTLMEKKQRTVSGKIQGDRKQRSTLSGNCLRRCRLSACRFRFGSPRMSENHRIGQGRRIEGRAAAACHLVAFPFRDHRPIRRQGKRNAYRRTQCRPDGRRCSSGCERKNRCGTLRPFGWNCSDSRWRSRCIEGKGDKIKSAVWTNIRYNNCFLPCFFSFSY